MTALPPLAGIRVLELSTSAAGQIAGMLLADLGADVVRIVDAADGERVSEPAGICWNRGKTLVADRTDVDRLISIAELLLTDDTPHRHHHDRLDAASLSARAPGLSSVWMPPAALRGEWTELPADHILLDGLAGVAVYQQGTTGAPSAAVVPSTHVIQGALAAVAGVAGLITRRRDGWGRSATVSGLHGAAAASFALGALALDGPPVLGSTGLLPGPPHMRLYQAGDGRWLYLAAVSFEHFVRALEVLDRVDVLVHPTLDGEFINVMRPEAMDAVGHELETAFRTRSCAEWLAALAASNVVAAEVRSASDWLSSDVLAHACPPVTTKSSAQRSVTMPGAAIRFEATPAVVGALPDPDAVVAGGDVWADTARRADPTGTRTGEDDRPLAGLRVLDVTTFMAGPFAGALLAGCGADVTKVEPPSGDPYAPYTAPYTVMNHQKRRVHLDLRQATDHATFLDMVGSADLVIDNLAAPSLARLDLAPERFGDVNPSLVRCSLSAFGPDGPYAEQPGFDQMVQALSGLMIAQGGADRPLAISVPVHDITTGCLAALGSLTAVLARDMGRCGQRVYTSLAAASALIQSGELTTYERRPPRLMGGVDWPGPSSWRRYYPAADRWIAISATTASSRQALLGVVARPDLLDAEDGTRAEAISAGLRRRPAARWLDALSAAGVPACPVAERLEFDLPYLVENGFTQVLPVADVGRLRVPGRFVEWCSSEPPAREEVFRVAVHGPSGH